MPRRQSCKLGAVTQIQEEREAESGKHSPKTRGRLHAAHHERRNEYLRLPSYKAAEDCARQSARAGCQETDRSSNPCGRKDELEKKEERRVPVARATWTTHSLMSGRPCGPVSLVGGKHGPRGERRAERCHRMSSIAPRRNQGRERWRPSPESSESQPLPPRQEAKIENRQIDTATAGMSTVQNCST